MICYCPLLVVCIYAPIVQAYAYGGIFESGKNNRMHRDLHQRVSPPQAPSMAEWLIEPTLKNIPESRGVIRGGNGPGKEFISVPVASKGINGLKRTSNSDTAEISTGRKDRQQKSTGVSEDLRRNAGGSAVESPGSFSKGFKKKVETEIEEVSLIENPLASGQSSMLSKIKGEIASAHNIPQKKLFNDKSKLEKGKHTGKKKPSTHKKFPSAKSNHFWGERNNVVPFPIIIRIIHEKPIDVDKEVNAVFSQSNKHILKEWAVPGKHAKVESIETPGKQLSSSKPPEKKLQGGNAETAEKLPKTSPSPGSKAKLTTENPQKIAAQLDWLEANGFQSVQPPEEAIDTFGNATQNAMSPISSTGSPAISSGEAKLAEKPEGEVNHKIHTTIASSVVGNVQFGEKGMAIIVPTDAESLEEQKNAAAIEAEANRLPLEVEQQLKNEEELLPVHMNLENMGQDMKHPMPDHIRDIIDEKEHIKKEVVELVDVVPEKEDDTGSKDIDVANKESVLKHKESIHLRDDFPHPPTKSDGGTHQPDNENDKEDTLVKIHYRKMHVTEKPGVEGRNGSYDTAVSHASSLGSGKRADEDSMMMQNKTFKSSYPEQRSLLLNPSENRNMLPDQASVECKNNFGKGNEALLATGNSQRSAKKPTDHHGKIPSPFLLRPQYLESRSPYNYWPLPPSRTYMGHAIPRYVRDYSSRYPVGRRFRIPSSPLGSLPKSLLHSSQHLSEPRIVSHFYDNDKQLSKQEKSPKENEAKRNKELNPPIILYRMFHKPNRTAHLLKQELSNENVDSIKVVQDERRRSLSRRLAQLRPIPYNRPIVRAKRDALTPNEKQMIYDNLNQISPNEGGKHRQQKSTGVSEDLRRNAGGSIELESPGSFSKGFKKKVETEIEEVSFIKNPLAPGQSSMLSKIKGEIASAHNIPQKKLFNDKSKLEKGKHTGKKKPSTHKKFPSAKSNHFWGERNNVVPFPIIIRIIHEKPIDVDKEVNAVFSQSNKHILKEWAVPGKHAKVESIETPGKQLSSSKPPEKKLQGGNAETAEKLPKTSPSPGSKAKLTTENPQKIAAQLDWLEANGFQSVQPPEEAIDTFGNATQNAMSPISSTGSPAISSGEAKLAKKPEGEVNHKIHTTIASSVVGNVQFGEKGMAIIVPTDAESLEEQKNAAAIEAEANRLPLEVEQQLKNEEELLPVHMNLENMGQDMKHPMPDHIRDIIDEKEHIKKEVVELVDVVPEKEDDTGSKDIDVANKESVLKHKESMHLRDDFPHPPAKNDGGTHQPDNENDKEDTLVKIHYRKMHVTEKPGVEGRNGSYDTAVSHASSLGSGKRADEDSMMMQNKTFKSSYPEQRSLLLNPSENRNMLPDQASVECKNNFGKGNEALLATGNSQRSAKKPTDHHGKIPSPFLLRPQYLESRSPYNYWPLPPSRTYMGHAIPRYVRDYSSRYPVGRRFRIPSSPLGSLPKSLLHSSQHLSEPRIVSHFYDNDKQLSKQEKSPKENEAKRNKELNPPIILYRMFHKPNRTAHLLKQELSNENVDSIKVVQDERRRSLSRRLAQLRPIPYNRPIVRAKRDALTPNEKQMIYDNLNQISPNEGGKHRQQKSTGVSEDLRRNAGGSIELESPGSFSKGFKKKVETEIEEVSFIKNPLAPGQSSMLSKIKGEIASAHNIPQKKLFNDKSKLEKGKHTGKKKPSTHKKFPSAKSNHFWGERNNVVPFPIIIRIIHEKPIDVDKEVNAVFSQSNKHILKEWAVPGKHAKVESIETPGKQLSSSKPPEKKLQGGNAETAEKLPKTSPSPGSKAKLTTENPQKIAAQLDWLEANGFQSVQPPEEAIDTFGNATQNAMSPISSTGSPAISSGEAKLAEKPEGEVNHKIHTTIASSVVGNVQFGEKGMAIIVPTDAESLEEQKNAAAIEAEANRLPLEVEQQLKNEEELLPVHMNLENMGQDMKHPMPDHIRDIIDEKEHIKKEVVELVDVVPEKEDDTGSKDIDVANKESVLKHKESIHLRDDFPHPPAKSDGGTHQPDNENDKEDTLVKIHYRKMHVTEKPGVEGRNGSYDTAVSHASSLGSGKRADEDSMMMQNKTFKSSYPEQRSLLLNPSENRNMLPDQASVEFKNNFGKGNEALLATGNSQRSAKKPTDHHGKIPSPFLLRPQYLESRSPYNYWPLPPSRTYMGHAIPRYVRDYSSRYPVGRRFRIPSSPLGSLPKSLLHSSQHLSEPRIVSHFYDNDKQLSKQEKSPKENEAERNKELNPPIILYRMFHKPNRTAHLLKQELSNENVDSIKVVQDERRRSLSRRLAQLRPIPYNRPIVRAKRDALTPNEKQMIYDNLNQIRPETLRLLLPTMTEEPHRPRPTNHDCCYNGGTCHVITNDDDDSWCTCPPTFTGRLCDIDVDECANQNVCKAHQLCKNTYGSYSCSCAPHFVMEGEDCIPEVTCEEDPCLNGSDCVDEADGKVICLCKLGFLGTRCEKRVPECEDSSCSDGETCVSTPTGFKCLKNMPSFLDTAVTVGSI